MRQGFHKADSVADEHLCASGGGPFSRSRIQRREESVLDGHAGIGERVQQRALAGVGIADQADFEQALSGVDLANPASVNICKLASS